MKLFNLKPMSQDLAELRDMIDVVIKSLSLRELETIDLKLDSLSKIILINLLCSRFQEETCKAFLLSILKTLYPSHENYKQMSLVKIRLAVQHNTKHHGRSPTLFTPQITQTLK
jgi:hypothetical protein